MAELEATLVNDGKGGRIAFPPFISQDNMDALASDFTVRNDDVFVVAYPKCGTTWTEQIVHLLLHDGEQGDVPLTDAVPWIEAAPNRPQGFPAFVEQMVGRRAFTSHLPYELMPGVRTTRARYVYVARNPKDTAVSYYYHDRSKAGYDGSWDEHLQLFMRGELAFGSFFDHVLGWWRASRQAENILFITYEAMKQDLASVTRAIAAFIGVTADAELIEHVVEKSTFKAMATDPRTDFSWMELREGVPGHYRKGVVGDWRNHFSPAQNEVFDDLYNEKMAGSGLRFDFGGGLILP